MIEIEERVKLGGGCYMMPQNPLSESCRKAIGMCMSR